jgi:hypothetical protein
MSLHPAITAALVDQHRRDLMSQSIARRPARTARRPARTARQDSPRRPARRPLFVRALRTAAAATAIAATAFLVTPAGSGHAPSANGKWSVPFAGHGNLGTVHSLVLVHHFQGIHRFSDYLSTARWA